MQQNKFIFKFLISTTSKPSPHTSVNCDNTVSTASLLQAPDLEREPRGAAPCKPATTLCTPSEGTVSLNFVFLIQKC